MEHKTPKDFPCRDVAALFKRADDAFDAMIDAAHGNANKAWDMGDVVEHAFWCIMAAKLVHLKKLESK